MPLYMITLEKSDELSLLFHAFPEGLSDRETFHGIICANYEKCCMDAILQGAFLCGGYVTNPEKNYHLEFVSPNENIANIFSEFLREVYGFSPRTIKRKQNTIVYFKESENIEDMLSTMGAISSALSIMEIKVVKDVRNTVNRQVNCETANLTKTVDAFEKHKAAIEKISRTAGLESLSLPLREVANLRLSYPELSLKELGELANPKISKSGMNHRLKKLIEISESL